MTNKNLTKTELKAAVKEAYQAYLDAGAVYREMKGERNAPVFKLQEKSIQSRSVGFTCFYHSHQKNSHLSNVALAQAYLDIVTTTNEMWNEIAEAATATTN